MSALWQDLRHSLRLLARNPGFTLVAVLTLAVALGANTAVFSIMNGVLLKALPYRDADRLVALSVLLPPRGGEGGRSSYLDDRRLAHWPAPSGTIERIAPYRTRSFTLSGFGAPERLSGAQVAVSLFDVLGVSPVQGRTFAREESRAGRERVVVLSHRLWKRRFQGSPGIVGRSLTLDGWPYTVVGVMPETFFFPHREVELWTPLSFHETPSPTPGAVSVENLPVVARLRPRASIPQAEAESQSIFELGRVVSGPEDDLREGRVQVLALRDQIVGEVRPALLEMSVAVGLVLLIACINLANLLLARNGARAREMAIRCAVGGSRGRLVRQLLTESAVLSVLGGFAGVALALSIQRLLPWLLPHDLPRVENVRLDGVVLLFALVLALLTGAAVGLLPAFRSARTSLVVPLHGGVADTAPGWRSRGLLVVGEVALACFLLVGAALLVRSYLEIAGIDLGYEPGHVLTATLDLDPGRYGAAGRGEAFFDEILGRLGEDGRVQAAGVISFPPLTSGFSLTSLSVRGEPRRRTVAVPQLSSPGYLAAMGLKLARGRWLSPGDRSLSSRPAVVNETFVHRYMGGSDPIGRELDIGSGAFEVVGVVRDARTVGVELPPKPEVFASYRDARVLSGQEPLRLTLAVRAAGDAESVAPYLRAVLFQLDPTLAPEEVRTMSSKLSSSAAEPRFYALLLGAFAVIALVLAAAGVYGVLAYSVIRQTRAIGVRRALGARGRDILAMVLGRSLWLLAAGIAIGLTIATIASRVLAHLLFGVTPRDPLSFVASALVLLSVGLAASFLPARRAIRVAPLEALRIEG